MVVIKRIGIFVSSVHLENYFHELMDDLGPDQEVHRSRKVIMTPNTMYSFHAIDGVKDLRLIYGHTFDFVQIHWSVKPDCIGTILSRCRSTCV